MKKHGNLNENDADHHPMVGIPGRLAAKKTEKEYIETYEKQFGYPPPGNETEDD